ncbi:hypothetical protein GCM10010272_32490 [Streptomyces lateritius]|nr:hypothetical protein GCM10010272_32490 [Streptomyces lateritius]
MIVIDPLISARTAAAALALSREHRGDRPVTGLIHTHSHGDHFGSHGFAPGTEEVRHAVGSSTPPPWSRAAAVSAV